jgi:geranylgeranyl diphosphate synthase type I
MIVKRSPDPSARLVALRARVDRTLDGFLRDMRAEISGLSPDALPPIDEVIRLIAAGGKRLRPAFCYWGYRAARGPDGEPIVRAAAALELLHTMALIHDDLMDEATERRNVPSSAVHLAEQAGRPNAAEADRIGRSLAILAGDLAAVLADRLLLASGFDADRLVPALDRYHRMRTAMAAGQCLDITGWREDSRTVAALKGGGYTVEGPLRIGAALAGADGAIEAALVRYGRPLGLAFQLRDDERDGDATPGAGEIATLTDEARLALEGVDLDIEVAAVLRGLVDLVEAG